MSKPRSKTPVIPPTPDEIPALVDRAAVLENEIAVRQAELDQIRARLDLAAIAAPAEPLKEAHREGVRAVLSGSRFRAVAVVTSDSLLSSFRDNDEKHKELLKVLAEDAAADVPAEDLLKRFFHPPVKWTNAFRDGLRFRQAAKELLSEPVAAKLLVACRATTARGIPKSATKMTFEPMPPPEVEQN